MRDDAFIVGDTILSARPRTKLLCSAPLTHRRGGSRTLVAVKTAMILSLSLLGWGCAKPQLPQSQLVVKPFCERTITADVVALDQVYYYNRFGSFNPAGIMYALRRDVVRVNKSDGPDMTGAAKSDEPEPDLLNGDLDTWPDEKEDPIPAKYGPADAKLAGQVKLRADKRPRPLVLRANEGDCLQVTFTNLLSPEMSGQEVMLDPEKRLTIPEKRLKAISDSDEPSTRHASIHVNGLSLVDTMDSQGANVGRNGWYRTDEQGKRVATAGQCSTAAGAAGKDLCALAAPGETRTYTWFAKKEGTYLFYSMGAPAGGEGDGGRLGLGAIRCGQCAAKRREVVSLSGNSRGLAGRQPWEDDGLQPACHRL